MSAKPVVVLGAGCAGLAAAYRLQKKGRSVVVVEREDHPGGLAGGIRIGGSVYEYGPHIFHTTDPQILADIKELMGEELLPYKRTIQIKFLGNYFQFPLSIRDVLFKLPLRTVAWAAVTFVYRFVQGLVRKPEVETSETILLRYYGDVLYKIFFKDYIERVWGIGPAQFSPAFARERIPRFNVLDFADKIAHAVRRRLGRRVRTQGFVEKVEGELYTTREGFSLITRRMAERLEREGGKILYETRVVGIDRKGSTVTSVEVLKNGVKETLECSALINTLPINETARMFSPPLDEATRDQAARLRFRAIVFVGLKVRRARVLPASFMYFREHSFNRITDLSSFSFKIEPPGRTILVAEVTCDPDKDSLWTDEQQAKDAVIADVVREGLVAREEIEEAHVYRARHGHPMYTLGYERALAAVLAAFDGLDNFQTAGRQGRFQYVNTHVAMKMGYEAADRLTSKEP